MLKNAPQLNQIYEDNPFMKGFCHRSLLFTRTDKKGTTDPIDIISQIPLNNISKINNLI